MDTTFEVEKQDKGFTLVELLIVIVILGILATVTVFAVSGITQQADENACLNEVATVETAIEAYNVGENGYPADLTALSPDYLKDSDLDYVVAGDYDGSGVLATDCATVG
jgi:prepilin-type N-terminal cleavage/methylation domain-containing protein